MKELQIELLFVLEHFETRKLFLAFLESEFAVENVFFVEACDEFSGLCVRFHSTPTIALQREIMLLKESIYDTFIKENSPSCVNVSSQTRQNLLDLLYNSSSIRPSTMATTDLMASTANLNDTLLKPTEDENFLFKSSSHEEMALTGSSFHLNQAVIPVDERHLFDEAKQEILGLMVTDSFTRFRPKERKKYDEILKTLQKTVVIV
eukprot:TRINITY_DN27394_c0_g4_i1.p1 TRINITY_DN27394_c0_g4~~TRINITY_DN27394_c0_g4_i1.p1  ORF type:complete len:237 (+),score=54.77 TRINITY_DN27394_c0_g4_i1:96-713(+)